MAIARRQFCLARVGLGIAFTRSGAAETPQGRKTHDDRRFPLLAIRKLRCSAGPLRRLRSTARLDDPATQLRNPPPVPDALMNAPCSPCADALAPAAADSSRSAW